VGSVEEPGFVMRLKNIPIPQAYLGGLLAGILLQIFFSPKLFPTSWIGILIGLPFLILGIGISAWSVTEANELDIDNPDRLLTGGPYAFSRNPMYVGWTLIYIGAAFILNMVWPIALLPLVVIYIHFVDIRKEEQILENQFGENYLRYKDRVRRYL
jgi:protein-S-isoprenylcysteine O-methyltransferase Ste14